MKMKKMLATVMATALAVTMIPAAAFASGSDPIDWNNNNGVDERTGDGTVRQPIIEVTLPGDLAFEVDPLKLNSKAEILGGDYNIINHSEVPVKVTVKPYINLEDNDTLKVVSGNTLLGYANNGTNATAVNGYKPISANDASDKKAVSMLAIAADQTAAATNLSDAGVYAFGYKGTSGIKAAGRNALTYNEDGTVKYSNNGASLITLDDSGAANGVIWLTGDKATANELAFLLGPDTYVDEVSQSIEENGNIKAGKTALATSFTFTGAVDPRMTYEDGEINVAADFEMNIVTDDDLQNITYHGNAVTTASGATKTVAGTDRQQLITVDTNSYQ